MKELATAAKHRAKPKGIPFNISGGFLLNMWEAQEGKCALTGIPFNLALGETKGIASKDGPSVDRITPHLGYTKDNVRLVTFQVNMAKGSYTDKDFFYMCRKASGRAH